MSATDLRAVPEGLPIAPFSARPAPAHQTRTAATSPGMRAPNPGNPHKKTGAMLQIVPTLPPVVGGVGDYAVVLGRELARTGRTNAFLARRGGDALADEFSVANLGPVDARDASGTILTRQLEELGDKTVVLHLSGYGFSRWGLCFGLGAGLGRWRRADPERRLVLIAHELYATGPFWRASFWTAAPQIVIARQLAAIADSILTPSEATREILARWRDDLDVRAVPVFSTVGEATDPPAWSARQPVAVVFGSAPRRTAVYRALADARTAASFATAGIERIVDIGAPFSGLPATAAGVTVEALGLASAEAVADTLGNARYGLAHYPHHLVAKSTILAACFAHSLVAVNLAPELAPDPNGRDGDRDRGKYRGKGRLPAGLAIGRELLDFPAFRSASHDPARVAAAGHAWYRGHCVENVAALIATMADDRGAPDSRTPDSRTLDSATMARP